MKIRKLIAMLIAAVMCFSLSAVAFAVNGEEESTQENTTVENPSAEESTSEEVSEEPAPEESTSEENPSEENSSEAPSEEESSKAPDKDDVISLIVNLLGKIDLEEVKDAFNDINEALGLPRIESYKDIPAYADALYGKLEEMGLGYGDIINGLASSDLLDWLNKLLFGGGSSAPSTTVPSDNNVEEMPEENPDAENSPIPDTGISIGAVAAAVAVMGGSGALAFILRKRNPEED